jgi:deoxyhypusine monooxygenase
MAAPVDTVSILRTTLTSESEPLAKRFRALFSLKHLAAATPKTEQTDEAVAAIAAAFTSPSALLKHELAYCLGQTRQLSAAPYLQDVLKDKAEDPMCRHEAAEALAALGDTSSLELLKEMRDDEAEEVVVRETCEIAVDRIQWEAETASKEESLLKKRQFIQFIHNISNVVQRFLLHRSRASPSEQADSINTRA